MDMDEGQRERQTSFERWRYLADLADDEREGIKPALPQPARRSRKPKVNLGEILNAVRYLAGTGRG
jgi:hypothetical protein